MNISTKFLLAVSGLLVSSFTVMAADPEPERPKPPLEQRLPPLEPGPVIIDPPSSGDMAQESKKPKAKVRKRSEVRKRIAARHHHEEAHPKTALRHLVHELHRLGDELHKVHHEKLRDVRRRKHEAHKALEEARKAREVAHKKTEEAVVKEREAIVTQGEADRTAHVLRKTRGVLRDQENKVARAIEDRAPRTSDVPAAPTSPPRDESFRPFEQLSSQ